MTNKTTNTAVIWTVAPEKPKLTGRQILNRLLKIEEAKRKIKALNAEIDALKAEIIGGADTVALDTPQYRVSYAPVVSTVADTKRLKADGLFERYSMERVAKRFDYTIR